MELLSGWKEIASHLHLTVRTAQRWEHLGLPVRRVSESVCSPVVAIPDEIELWARTRDIKTDAALLASNKFLVTRLAEVSRTHLETRRETRDLLGDLRGLRTEHRRLLALVLANLTPPSTSLAEKKDSAAAADQSTPLPGRAAKDDP